MVDSSPSVGTPLLSRFRSGTTVFLQKAIRLNNEKIFNAVLSRPLIKARQIIWSTGSPNVPAALDAEKIIITREKIRGKLMVIHCAGDFHEDEIREQFLNHFEGGWAGFARRDTIYSS